MPKKEKSIEKKGKPSKGNLTQERLDSLPTHNVIIQKVANQNYQAYHGDFTGFGENLEEAVFDLYRKYQDDKSDKSVNHECGHFACDHCNADFAIETEEQKAYHDRVRKEYNIPPPTIEEIRSHTAGIREVGLEELKTVMSIVERMERLNRPWYKRWFM